MIKELRRNVEIEDSEELVCSPVSDMCAVAEMEIEEDGVRKFLTAEWINLDGGEITFEVTSESIADIMLFRSDDMEKLERLRHEEGYVRYLDITETENSKYEESFAKINVLLKEKLAEKGIILG